MNNCIFSKVGLGQKTNKTHKAVLLDIEVD